MHTHEVTKKAGLLLPIDVVGVAWLAGLVGEGVADDDEDALGARRPGQVAPHQPQHHLVRLGLVTAKRRLHLQTGTRLLGQN